MTLKSEQKKSAKEIKLSENQLLMDRLIRIEEENQSLKQALIEEATKVRIPNKLNAYQFNQLVEHLTKIREEFLKVLNVPAALDIEEPIDPCPPEDNE